MEKEILELLKENNKMLKEIKEKFNISNNSPIYDKHPYIAHKFFCRVCGNNFIISPNQDVKCPACERLQAFPIS